MPFGCALHAFQQGQASGSDAFQQVIMGFIIYLVIQ